jgi:hypothetical protein
MRGRRGNPFERAFHLRACGLFPLHSSPRPLIVRELVLVLAFPLRRGEAPDGLVLSIRVFPDHRPLLASRLRGSKIEYELEYEYEYDFKNDCEETGAKQIQNAGLNPPAPPTSAKIIVSRFDRRMAFVPEGPGVWTFLERSRPGG